METYHQYQRPHPFTILLADDDEDDILLTQDAMAEAGIEHALDVVKDGEALLSLLQERKGREPLPNIILLDLNMPILDGKEVLAELKADEKLKAIPVIILSTSNTVKDIDECYALGAASFITKPKSFNDLISIMQLVNSYWYQCVNLPSSQVYGTR
jgi:two-component system response regulator